MNEEFGVGSCFEVISKFRETSVRPYGYIPVVLLFV